MACVLINQGFLESAQTVLEGIVCCFGGTTDRSSDLYVDKRARVLISFGSLTRIKGLRGDLKHGEKILTNILHIQRDSYGLEHSSTMTTFSNLIQHLHLQSKGDETVKMLKEAMKKMTPGNPQSLSILNQLASFLERRKVYSETEHFFREMLEIYTRTLGANHPSTMSVSESLNYFALTAKWQRGKEKSIMKLEETKQRLGANHPQTLEDAAMIKNTVTEVDNYLRLPSLSENDAEERRWNDAKSRGWDDELHGRLVSTIAKYKEKTRNELPRDGWEQLQVGCYEEVLGGCG